MRILTMMIHTIAVPGLLLVLMTCAAAQSNLVAPDTDSHCGDAHVGEGDRPRLPQNALQIARILGVRCDIERLSSLQAAKGPNRNSYMRYQCACADLAAMVRACAGVRREESQ